MIWMMIWTMVLMMGVVVVKKSSSTSGAKTQQKPSKMSVTAMKRVNC